MGELYGWDFRNMAGFSSDIIEINNKLDGKWYLYLYMNWLKIVYIIITFDK